MSRTHLARAEDQGGNFLSSLMYSTHLVCTNFSDRISMNLIGFLTIVLYIHQQTMACISSFLQGARGLVTKLQNIILHFTSHKMLYCRTLFMAHGTHYNHDS